MALVFLSKVKYRSAFCDMAGRKRPRARLSAINRENPSSQKLSDRTAVDLQRRRKAAGGGRLRISAIVACKPANIEGHINRYKVDAALPKIW